MTVTRYTSVQHICKNVKFIPAPYIDYSLLKTKSSSSVFSQEKNHVFSFLVGIVARPTGSIICIPSLSPPELWEHNRLVHI